MASTINAKNTSTGVVITPDSSGQLELQTVDTTRLTIDANGNVGIGTSSPSSRLEISSTSYTGFMALSSYAGLNGNVFRATSTSGIPHLGLQSWSTWTTGKDVAQIRIDGLTTTGAYTEYAGIYATAGTNTSTGAPTALWFSTSNGSSTATERMRIDSSGNVGIGTSSPLAQYSLTTQSRLYVNNQGTDMTPDASWTGQITARGSGYNGGIALDSTGLWLGHNSASRAILFATDETERMRIDSSGNLLFNSGYGSVATAYGCRAWVKFDSTSGTPTINGQGNVSSLTDGGAGVTTVNFTTAMPDANYAVSGFTQLGSTTIYTKTFAAASGDTWSSSAVTVRTASGTANWSDSITSVTIIR